MGAQVKFHERVRNILTHTGETQLRVQALEVLNRLKDHEPLDENADSSGIHLREGDTAVLAAAFLTAAFEGQMFEGIHGRLSSSVIKEFLPQPGGGRIIKAVVEDSLVTKDGIVA